MKSLIKIYLIATLSLFFVSKFFSGIVLEKGLVSLALAGLGLAAVSLLIKPLINLLLLPLNLVTFGLFRWVSSAIALYLVTLVVPGFKISGFHFAGLTTHWLDIPAFGLPGILAFVGFSFALSIISSFLHWLIK